MSAPESKPDFATVAERARQWWQDLQPGPAPKNRAVVVTHDWHQLSW